MMNNNQLAAVMQQSGKNIAATWLSSNRFSPDLLQRLYAARIELVLHMYIEQQSTCQNKGSYGYIMTLSNIQS